MSEIPILGNFNAARTKSFYADSIADTQILGDDELTSDSRDFLIRRSLELVFHDLNHALRFCNVVWARVCLRMAWLMLMPANAIQTCFNLS